MRLKILSRRLLESDEYFLAVNMNCFVLSLKLKVRETESTMLFPPCRLVYLLRAPVYFGSVLCAVGGNHSSLWSVFWQSRKPEPAQRHKTCCSIEAHLIFSVLKYTFVVTRVQLPVFKGGFLIENYKKTLFFYYF